MTDHPCKGMTEHQIEVFERLAISQPVETRWETIDALIAKGVIVKGPSETRRDAMGIYTVPSYSVPLPVHAQWCQWCSEQHDAQNPRG